jgi:predicted O-methyltransferase YrrM
MSFWYDKDNRCSYEEWVDRAGGLMKALDTFLKSNKINTVLEFGTGNSTRVFAKNCERVITVDSNEYSIIVPVDEQGPSGYSRDLWSQLKKEDNVEFICGDILKLDFSMFKKYNPDLILLDVGSTLEDKYLYGVLYDRLKSCDVLSNNPVLFIDNSDACIPFLNRLMTTEGYTITDTGSSQAIARKK